VSKESSRVAKAFSVVFQASIANKQASKDASMIFPLTELTNPNGDTSFGIKLIRDHSKVPPPEDFEQLDLFIVWTLFYILQLQTAYRQPQTG
jgi:hypothetical protein